MLRKTIKNRCSMILIVFAFCLSSATWSSSLIFGSEVHFHQDHMHVHHTDKDHGPGGSDHQDANTILYLDYVVTNPASHFKTLSCLNIFSSTHNSPTYCCILNKTLSVLSHYENKKGYCFHSLYQRKSSYLI